MTAVEPGSRRSNGPRALAFAAAVFCLLFGGGALVDEAGQPMFRVGHGLFALGILLAPFALVWVVGEAHLRWSPRARVPRGVVGWTLALGTLGLLIWVAPLALYLFIVALDGFLHG